MNERKKLLVRLEGATVHIDADGVEEAGLVLEELEQLRLERISQPTAAAQVDAINRAIVEVEAVLCKAGFQYVPGAKAPNNIIKNTRSSHIQPHEDTEERYRQHLAQLISRTKSRGHSRYFNQYVNRCRDEAAVAYPKGAAAARKKDMAVGGILGILAALFSFFG